MYSVYLPKTNFNIYEKDIESDLLNYWEKIDLQKLRENKRKGSKPFIIHDGPPYANGPLHMGHAENKIWKDLLNKFYWQSGFDTQYVLGWDAHGLPIENAVEKELKKENIDKKTLTKQEFWDKCFDFASHWIEVQKAGFKKLGVFADYDNPYITFQEKESIGIMECIHFFVEKNLITQKYRPVLWSYVEKTALAYAEVEYKNKKSQSLYLAFPIAKTNCSALKNVNILVWTTTPWTIPSNKAVCYNEKFTYIIFSNKNKKYCIEKGLMDSIKDIFMKKASSANNDNTIKIIEEISGNQFEGSFAYHCLEEFNNQDLRPLLHGNHVDNEKGTGFVHTAPGHGEEDFEVCLKNNINIEDYLDFDGCFRPNIPLVGGMHVKDANSYVIEVLKCRDSFIYCEDFEHSYPHSWRSKAPLIYRLTKQWFLNMKVLKKNALDLAQSEDLGWVPIEAKNRFIAMCGNREDWCISRQRIWGVPLGIFYNENSGKILSDPVFLQKTRNYLFEKGVKNWGDIKIEDIDSTYSSKDWKRVDDIVDIWFESGSTHDFVLKPNNIFPADVYLEGSDQHRGWFQSSFLISATKNGVSPWKNLLTHGFCLDGEKQKMSKSLGNVIDPLTWDMDTLRILFSSLQLSFDIYLSENIIKRSNEMVFRFKNTLKFLLGNLAISKDIKSVDLYSLSYMEKWILHRIYELDSDYEEVLSTFCVNNFTNKLYEFCSQDLSAFYFDIRKDTLYCDIIDSEKRAGVITVFRILTPILIKYLALIMPYSMENAWKCYLDENDIEKDDNSISVHLQNRPIISDLYRDDEVNDLINKFAFLKKKMNEKVEFLRDKKEISTTYEIRVRVNSKYYKELKDVFIVSEVIFNESLTNIDDIADLSEVNSDDLLELEVIKDWVKCPRCKFLYQNLHPELCKRCLDILKSI